MRKILSLAAAVLLLGACGGGSADPSENPKQAVIDAFDQLASMEGVSMTLSLDSDEESLTAGLSETGATPPSPDVIDAILGSTFTVGGTNETDPEEVEFEMTYAVDGEPLFEMVQEGFDVYGRAEVRSLVDVFGGDPAQLEGGLEGLPPELDFVPAAVEGEWLHLTGIEEFTEMMGGADPAKLGAQQKQALEAFSAAFEENAEFSEGEDEGPGTNVEVRIAAKPMIEEFLQIAVDSGTIPADQAPSAAMLDEVLGQMPEGDLIMDTWIEGGEVTQLRFDLIDNAAEFGAEDSLPEGLERLALVIEMDEFERQIEIPDDAVEVDFAEVMQGFMSQSFGSSSSSSTEVIAPGSGEPGDPCEMIADLPAEQQEAYKDLCPDL